MLPNKKKLRKKDEDHRKEAHRTGHDSERVKVSREWLVVEKIPRKKEKDWKKEADRAKNEKERKLRVKQCSISII